MKVLLTGDAGYVGAPVALHLLEEGHEVVGFDVARGQDLLDPAALTDAARSCEVVVHAAALAHDTAGSPEQIFSTNVTGTWNALAAAESAGARVFVHFSSAQVFGIAEGEHPPAYLPVDDDHPRNATRPYGLSKRFGEDLCEAATRRTGMATIAIRPVAVWQESTYERIWNARATDPSYEWSPFWEYGAFVDVRDVATAVAAALTLPPGSHHRVTLCASDISASKPALEMVEQLLPSIGVRGDRRHLYQDDAWRALFDISATTEVLGWRPVHTWAAFRAER